MIIGMGLPMIQQFASSISGLKTAFSEWQTAQALANLQQELSLQLTEKDIILTAEESALAKELGVSELELALAKKMVAEGSVENIEAGLALIAERTGEIAVTDLLTAALARLTGMLRAAFAAASAFIATPLGAAITALTVVVGTGIAVFNAYQEAEKQAAEAAKEAMEKSEEAVKTSSGIVDSINKEKEAYDSLRDSYDQTGARSDEFKESTIRMAEALGITDAKVKVLRGEFSSLANEIDKATAAQLANHEANLRTQKNLLDKQIKAERESAREKESDIAKEMAENRTE